MMFELVHSTSNIHIYYSKNHCSALSILAVLDYSNLRYMKLLFLKELCELYFQCTLMICYSSLRNLRPKNFLEKVVILFIRPCNHFGKLAYIITKIMCTVRGRLNCVQTVEVHTVCSTKYVQQQQPAAITRRTQRILQKAHTTTKHEIKGLRQSKCTILLKAAKFKRVF